jgi:flagellar assembly protein FliH
MRSFKKVIKASSIRIAGQHRYETASDASMAGSEAALSALPNRHTPSPDDREGCEKDGKTEDARRTAYEQGMAEGMKRGVAKQRQEVSELVNSLSGLITELTNVRKEFLGNIEKEVLDLAFAIAEKIVNHEVLTDREVICRVLEGALTKMVDHEGMTLRVNPNDYRYLVENNQDMPAGWEGMKNIVLEQDAAVGQGGVVIVSALGEVDARLDQQMGVLKEALTSA